MPETLGEDALAEKVYLLLLAKNDLDLVSLADRLGVGAEQVRKAFDRLGELALLKPSWEAPGQFRPVDAEAGLRVLLNRRRAELVRQQQSIAESHAAIAHLTSQYADLRLGLAQQDADRLIGMDAIMGCIESLAARAHIEIATFMPGGPQSPAMIEVAKPLDLQVRQRGVAMRTVCLDSIRQDPLTLAFGHWLTGIGGEVRTVPTLPVRMIIYDRCVAIVPLDPDNSQAGAVRITNAGTVVALMALFEQVWTGATPIEAASGRHNDGLSLRERQLLSLLGEGMTDERAGRHLGVTPRTVRRIMADLMERMGARSRFEAGLRSARRGWL